MIIISCEEELPPVTYSLTTQVTPEGSGIVSPSSGTFDEGASITISATPSANYIFKQWTGTEVVLQTHSHLKLMLILI